MIRRRAAWPSEFQTQVDDLVREANLHEVRDQINEIRNFDIRGQSRARSTRMAHPPTFEETPSTRTPRRPTRRPRWRPYGEVQTIAPPDAASDAATAWQAASPAPSPAGRRARLHSAPGGACRRRRHPPSSRRMSCARRGAAGAADPRSLTGSAVGPADVNTAPEDDPINDKPMPLLDHLIELRRRLLWSIAAFVIAFFVCYYFSGRSTCSWPSRWRRSCASAANSRS